MSDCDVAVIGAGVIGAAITYELVSRGASVTLLDSRGAGLGAPRLLPACSSRTSKDFAIPFFRLPSRASTCTTRSSVASRATPALASAIAVPGHCRWRPPTNHSTNCRVWRGARSTGVDCELLDAKSAREAEPQLSPEVAGALLVRSHGFVVATDLSGALSAAAIKHGTRVRVPARATRIGSGGDLVEVQLDNDRLTARHVILAAGSWSGQIAIDGVPPLPVKPIRGQLLQLACDGPALKRIVWGSRCYLVPARPGMILVGATVEDAGFDERTTVAGVRDLLDAACDLVPRLWQAALVGARVGLRPRTTTRCRSSGDRRRYPDSCMPRDTTATVCCSRL